MTLEEIHSLWEQDSIIDRTNLDDESLKIPQLHSKYFRIFSKERLKLKKLELSLTELKFLKKEFFTEGPNEESKEKGWNFPPRGKILKSDADLYTINDKDVQKAILEVALQKEKVDVLENVIQSINSRSWQIKNAIDWMAFTNGSN